MQAKGQGWMNLEIRPCQSREILATLVKYLVLSYNNRKVMALNL